jgi:hypothetical protein
MGSDDQNGSIDSGDDDTVGRCDREIDWERYLRATSCRNSNAPSIVLQALRPL